MKISARLALAVLISLVPLAAFSMPIAVLTLDSEQGDYIGQGRTADITYTGFFSAQARRTTSDGTTPTELLFVLGTVSSGLENTFALLFFGTDALGIPMQIGNYTDSQRADFATLGHPGLDISFQNRGCNQSSGNFSVNQYSLSSAALASTGFGVEHFEVSFEQHCERASAPALFGTFYYDAFGRLPVSVPEPTTPALLAIGLIGLVFSRRRNLIVDWGISGTGHWIVGCPLGRNYCWFGPKRRANNMLLIEMREYRHCVVGA